MVRLTFSIIDGGFLACSISHAVTQVGPAIHLMHSLYKINVCIHVSDTVLALLPYGGMASKALLRTLDLHLWPLRHKQALARAMPYPHTLTFYCRVNSWPIAVLVPYRQLPLVPA